MTPIAIFRCDASPAIGAGHVSRCLALAEALGEAGWSVRFVVGPETPRTFPSILHAGFGLRVLAADERDIGAMRTEAVGGVDLVVIDHYERDAAFESECRSFARKILVFDDMTGRTHDCDLLLDAASQSVDVYRAYVPPQARVLAGPAYAVVRRAFRDARPAALARRDGRPVRSVLVSCGATDPGNVTAVALDALAAWPDISVTVVLSSEAPHVEAIRARLPANAVLVTDADNMPELMTAADLAIGTPGASAYERAVLGLPSILVTVADNQRGIVQIMEKAGAAADAGPPGGDLSQRIGAQLARLIGDPQARVRLAQASSALIDGRGAMRVLTACAGQAVTGSGRPIRLRLASDHDETWLYDLQCEPQTRRHFRNPAIPTRSEHRSWLKRTLDDPSRLLFVIESDRDAVGMLRLDRREASGQVARYEVSIAVAHGRTKTGVGSAALAAARRLFPSARFEAEIAPANIASARLFGAAGYVPDDVRPVMISQPRCSAEAYADREKEPR